MDYYIYKKDKKKSKDFEQLPLYIEKPPIQFPKKEKKEEVEERGVIVIEII